MSESYEKVLKEWGRRRLLADKPHLPEDVVVTHVDVYECEPMGYCETCYSPGYIDITIDYVLNGLDVSHYINARDEDYGWNSESEYETLTGLIRDLEKIAEDMDKKGE